jgi:hypothetical protein
MTPKPMTKENLESAMNQNLWAINGAYGLYGRLAFDHALSTHTLLDIKFTIARDEGVLGLFNEAHNRKQTLYFQTLFKHIMHNFRYFQGPIMVVLWMQPEEGIAVQDETLLRRTFVIDYMMDERDREIVFGFKQNWTLMELLTIQEWADTARAGLHSNAPTGVGVGGRRFGWLLDLGFAKDELEYLCRLDFGNTNLTPGDGIYLKSSGAIPDPPTFNPIRVRNLEL